MVKLPTELAVIIFCFGGAMLLVCIVGKVNVKEIEFGTSNKWGRVILGFLGTLFIIFSIAPFLIEKESTTIPSDTVDTPSDFYAVVTTSKNPNELSRRYEKAKEISADKFGISRYDVLICPPLEGTDEYALIIGSKSGKGKINTHRSEAKWRIKQAEVDNFGTEGTVIHKATKSFKDEGCKLIQKAL
ncbi:MULTISPECIES: hypothetical protein [unclassified Moorena]|uniref:hypothetical protein n=1 Tax=unclassified Moorena TaxID=2683338 RepID=UPI0013B699C1|nr:MULTISPECIES: hypothetical protein [unclassified Moorena]NEO37830.1 hypothetical protein [Moorena sp. SIOASIH]NEO94603.1 hypothetical protein [Moorena sp. SIO3G5]NEP21218.1 hypothetical protein [Moorena sp. SIO3I6]